MLAIQSPSFCDLDIARQWVNNQSLDEKFYLVRVTIEIPKRGLDVRSGLTTTYTHYEFYSLDEMDEYGGAKYFDIVEVWE